VQFETTVPTIRDRVAQTAATLVLSPIFETEFADEMYGYRPRRNAQQVTRRATDLSKSA